MRRKPYTASGIKRVPCCKCGAPGYAQWTICADGPYRVICKDHDLELNKIGLEWMFKPHEAARKLRAYRERQQYES